MTSNKRNRKLILLGVTGSVATIKTKELHDLLYQWADVQLIASNAALHFLKQIPNFSTPYLTDDSEWHLWQKKGDEISHIQLRKKADALLIAPLSANTLSKIRFGLCNNLLTSICRTWDFKKPAILAPAMNTFMWEHPITQPSIKELEKWGYQIIQPISKVLACGDEGIGAMEEVSKINQFIKKILS